MAIQPPIAFYRMSSVAVNDGLLLPVLSLPIAGNLAVILVGRAVAILLCVEFSAGRWESKSTSTDAVTFTLGGSSFMARLGREADSNR